jgi:MoaA/NifB/PqqE/SkfB family radical SAM enzyme
VNIKTVISKANVAGFPELIRRFGKESGVLITPQPYYDGGDPKEAGEENFWIKDIALLTTIVDEVIALKRQGYNVCASEETLRGFIQYFQKKDGGKLPNENNKGQSPCLIGNTSIFVYANGDIKLCPYMGTIGNLGGEKTLKDIWYGKEAMDIRRKISLCTRDCELSCTRNTSLWERFLAFLKSA